MNTVDEDNNVVGDVDMPIRTYKDKGPFVNRTIKKDGPSSLDSIRSVLTYLATVAVLAFVAYILYRVYRWYKSTQSEDTESELTAINKRSSKKSFGRFDDEETADSASEGRSHGRNGSMQLTQASMKDLFKIGRERSTTGTPS